MEQELAEIGRRLSNMLRPGVVSEVDYGRALVRAESGDIKTDWLPFFIRRAGNTIDWDPPSPGEQCLILSPGGDLGAGFVLASLYSDQADAISKRAEETARKFEDGLMFSYDHKAHALTIARKEGLTIKLVGTKIDFQFEKVSIRNDEVELITALSQALDIIAKSKTPTLMGLRESIEDASLLPPIKQKLDSFME